MKDGQKIDIDDQCDDKQVYFKADSEVEVIEPKVEPWEQKENEMVGVGADEEKKNVRENMENQQDGTKFAAISKKAPMG